ncbi:nucleoside hydrolase [Lysinibacillus capsici]|uniref:nucleoside hydrolase n=1 Tax=Lysinibacillus capsici TaxID=2115968 RepID=UPI0027317775|nr:nucleoside hydrolase [Lysinibacillus capsici]MDP1392029.1 nucleoside hydrolase [Lysinibacillus capsici]MDP1412505.1 nucleoside hydrolase [Lysinibacillus capsici]MDP1428863.1 nucleoside hydrolase [Lysinibacillus capsici]
MFHCPQDPDDTIDLAIAYGLHLYEEIELKAIILEDGNRQESEPGQQLINQMKYLTNIDIPTAIGLASPLTSILDDGSLQSPKYQEGVNLILDTLRNSNEKIDIISIGSLRDLAAAFNREPALMRDKVDRVFVFAGEASNYDYTEYNVGLDVNAFVSFIQSGLNIYWLPCFDGGLWHNNRGLATWWRVPDQQVLYKDLSVNMKKYITYSLTGATGDEIDYINAPLDTVAFESLFGTERNLFCASIFMYLNNYLRDGDNLYSFKEIGIEVLLDGDILYNDSSPLRVKQFFIKDMKRYNVEMTNQTIRLLQRIE